MVETNVISNILGAVIGVPLMILFLYNVMFFLKLPMFNIKELNSSKYATLIMEKTLIVSKCNKGLYLSNEYVLDTINNKKMKKKDKKYLDDKMVKSMVKNKIIKTSKVNKLYKEGLIYKYVKENKEETK